MLSLMPVVLCALTVPAPQGYNKRATVHYMLGNFEESIQDCKMVLQLQVGPAACACVQARADGCTGRCQEPARPKGLGRVLLRRTRRTSDACQRLTLHAHAQAMPACTPSLACVTTSHARV